MREYLIISLQVFLVLLVIILLGYFAYQGLFLLFKLYIFNLWLGLLASLILTSMLAGFILYEFERDI